MKFRKRMLRYIVLPGLVVAASGITACASSESEQALIAKETVMEETLAGDAAAGGTTADAAAQDAAANALAAGDSSANAPVSESIALDENWTYASNSAIHTGTATLYRAPEGEGAAERKNCTVCVNAGHGTSGGTNVQTLSHPDGTPKVTGGTNAEGAVYSLGISTGMTFLDGTTEASVNLMVAKALKEKLLSDGYDVLMIRESDDVQLDNIARTVIANNCADLHVAIHFDSTDYDKGCFYMAVPEIASYKAMEPVASHWEEHNRLGQALIEGLQGVGLHLFGNGMMEMDLTQTSYSTIPSVDIEIGDQASDHSPAACDVYAQGLKDGIDLFAQSLQQGGASPETGQ